jgi:nicotinamidase-related amidase
MQLGSYDESYILRENSRAYDHGGADFELGAAGSALLVVDMLDEFVKPHWSPFWVPEATAQVPRIRRLIDGCREAGVPVIYTANAVHSRDMDVVRGSKHLPLFRVERGIMAQLFQKASIYSDLEPEPQDLVILKPTYDAFVGTRLDITLRNLGVDTVVICGTMTNFCCGTTARSAYMHGYNVVFGSDVTSSDMEELHRAEIRTLRRGFAMVLSSQEILSAFGFVTRESED